VNLTFLGAAREVTGSCFLIEAAGQRFLVDCGMFQGGMEAYRKNRARPRFDAREIDFVLLTHAHIDHSGLLPRLTKLGFRGAIYATRATCDLLEVMLPDAAFLQEREAERGRGRAEPLYTVADAQATLRQLRAIDYDLACDVRPGIRCRFRDAGHILGSSIIELWLTEGDSTRKIVFSGDIGQKGRPIVNDPTPIEAADVLIVESTYGNRLHRSLEDTEEELAAILNDTLGHRRGNVVIPAFAVGRTQEILHVLTDLLRRGRIRRRFPVYVDSPMATRATEVTLKHEKLVDAETRTLLAWQRQAGAAGLDVHFTESTEESRRLNDIRYGAVIISASGMCDAGRIRHHLRHNLPRAGSAIVISGFQAAGTLGRRLVDGARGVRIFREEVPVHARIHTVGGLSAHADRQGLTDWLSGFSDAPEHVYVVHGEVTAALDFAAHVSARFGWTTSVPAAGQIVSLDAPRAGRISAVT